MLPPCAEVLGGVTASSDKPRGCLLAGRKLDSGVQSMILRAWPLMTVPISSISTSFLYVGLNAGMSVQSGFGLTTDDCLKSFIVCMFGITCDPAPTPDAERGVLNSDHLIQGDLAESTLSHMRIIRYVVSEHSFALALGRILAIETPRDQSTKEHVYVENSGRL